MTKQKTKFKAVSREEKGRNISDSGKIKEIPTGWRIISQTNTSKSYTVITKRGKLICSCPDFQDKQNKCKHIFAIEVYTGKSSEGEEEVIKIKETYSQNWTAYNKAQCMEKISFMRFLREICDLIEQPTYKFGRPTYPFGDMLYGAVMRIYTGFSLRRFTSDMEMAKRMGIVEIVPSFSTISNFMNREEVQPILEKLISLSASPLRTIEKDFAVDSSGFSTSQFARWYDYKWGGNKKHKIWLKAHINSGVKTNIITGITITSGHSSDSNELRPLLEQTAENFEMREVSGDKAYSSKKNLEMIQEYGAIPFIPFKSNVSGRKGGSEIWAKMFGLFTYKIDEFMEHYSKRSNVETCFHMIKSKFGANIRSKKDTSMVNELLIKVLCHNLVVLIHEICELNIVVDFDKKTII